MCNEMGLIPKFSRLEAVLVDDETLSLKCVTHDTQIASFKYKDGKGKASLDRCFLCPK